MLLQGSLKVVGGSFLFCSPAKTTGSVATTMLSAGRSQARHQRSYKSESKGMFQEEGEGLAPLAKARASISRALFGRKASAPKNTPLGNVFPLLLLPLSSKSGATTICLILQKAKPARISVAYACGVQMVPVGCWNLHPSTKARKANSKTEQA